MQRMTSSFLQQSYLLLSVFHHPLCHSLFHSWLKTSFSANPSHRSLSFSSSGFTTWIPQTVYCYFWAYSVVYFLVFFLFLHFLIAGSVRWIKLTHVGFRAHVKISYRIKWSKTAISANMLCWLQCRLEVSGAIPSLQCQSLADQDRLTG